MNVRENMSRSKEVLGAYFRQGLHELGSALYGPGTAAQPPEYGMLGTKPPSMVVEGLKGEHDAVPARNDAAPSQLEAHLEQAKDRAEPPREPERDDRTVDRE